MTIQGVQHCYLCRGVNISKSVDARSLQQRSPGGGVGVKGWLTCVWPRGSRRSELEVMQKAILGVADIFAQEKLTVRDADIVEEVNSALEEARQNGQELDVERLKEQAYELLKVACPCTPGRQSLPCHLHT